MSTDHADTVKSLLDAAGIPDVYRGLMRDGDQIPEAAVFVESSGGAGPSSYFGGAIDTPTVQVFIRGPKRKRDVANATARAVFDAINHVEPAGYIDCKPLQSSPISVGPDKNERFIFSVNAILQIDE